MTASALTGDHRPRRTELLQGTAILIGGWFCAAALGANARMLTFSRPGGVKVIAWPGRFARQLALYGVWLPIAPVVAIAVRWIAASRLHAVLKVAAHLLLLAASVKTFAAGQQFANGLFAPPGRRMRTPFDFSVYPTAVVLHVMTAGLSLLGDATRRRRDQEREARRLAGEAEALRTSLVDAQLRALRMQLNPHFLYNTLNSIAALVVADPPLAEAMIARLGGLLRTTLEGSNVGQTTCARELEWLEEYLELQGLRFGDRLHVSLNADPEAVAASVPFLILQPLVENALEHGVGDVTRAGRVEIAVERHGERLRLSVRDNGAGMPANVTDPGIGLRNTRERLQVTYGAAAHLDVRSLPEGGTLAQVDLPFERA